MPDDFICPVCGLWFCDTPAKCKSLHKLKEWIASNPDKRKDSQRRYAQKTDRRGYFAQYYRAKKARQRELAV